MCNVLNYYWPEAKVGIDLFLLITFVSLTLSWWWDVDLIPFSEIVTVLFNRPLYVSQDFKGEKKIGSETQYTSLARRLSHLLRAEIKESFKEINGTLKASSH